MALLEAETRRSSLAPTQWTAKNM